MPRDPILDALDEVQSVGARSTQAGDPILAALDEVQAGAPAPDTRSSFARGYDALFTPPAVVTRMATDLANYIDTSARPAPNNSWRDIAEAVPDVARNLMLHPVATIRGGVAGTVEGVGSLVTPGDLGLLALGGAGRVVKSAKPLVTAALGLTDLATATRGAERAIDAQSPSEVAAGVAQTAMGAAGISSARRRPRSVASEPMKALPAGPRFEAAADGRIADRQAGQDIPMTKQPDGSFVRGVPADYARREVRGELPPGPRFTADAAGHVADVTAGDDVLRALDEVQRRPRERDASFVRGVPAEYPTRQRDDLLDILEGQAQDAAGDAPLRARVSEPSAGARETGVSASSGVTESAARGRETPPQRERRRAEHYAAVFEHVRDRATKLDPSVDVAKLREEFDLRTGFLEEQDQLFKDSGHDPSDLLRSIAKLGGLGPESAAGYRGEIRHLKEDAGKFGTLNDVPGVFRNPRRNARGQTVNGHGLDDMVRLLQQEPRFAWVEDVDDLMDALDHAARQGPAQTDVFPGTRELADRAGMKPDQPWWVDSWAGSKDAAASGNDYERFAKMFDEVTPDPNGEPGESGFIASELAAHVGGAAAGAAAGAASGDTTEEKITRGTLFGVAGAIAPALLRNPAMREVAARPRGGKMLSMPSKDGVPVTKGRSGAPITDPMKGTDPFLAKFSNPLVRDGVKHLLDEHAGYAAQRRGVIDTKTLGKFADEVKIHVDKTLPKGTTLNAEQITAYARALRQTQQKVNDLAGLVAKGAATDADIVALQAAKAEADVVGKSLMGARAEAGRALGAFNFWRGVMDTGDADLIRDALKAPGLREDAEKLAKGLAAQPDDPIIRHRWLQAQKTSTFADKVRGYYYANILSGVKTHERNFLGNLANVATELAVQPAAAGIDAAKSWLWKSPRTIRLDELPAKVAGAVAGMERGVSDFSFALRHGMTPASLSRGLEAGAKGKLDVPRVEFAGGAANPFNLPGRLLDASDAFFRSVARNMELYGLAHTQAKKEGLSGDAFTNRVADLRAATTPEGLALREQADTFATRAVFQEKPGPFVQRLQGIAHDYPAFSFVLPFLKTPGNIARQGLEFSPAGVAMKAAAQEGRAGTQAQARAAVGTAAAGVLAWLAASNRLSGEGPSDPAERAALMESGWRPNSVKIGDKWVEYSLAQPVSVQAAIIANAFEGWREAGAKPDQADVALSTIFRTINSFVSQSFLSGLFDLLEAIKDPDRSAQRFATRTASGLVPMSGFMRSVQQAADPVVRKPEGWKENLAAQIPGASSSVPARLDRFGQPVTREGGAVRRAADPLNVSTSKTDPIADELTRLGVTLGLPTDRLTLPQGRRLTREQERELQQQKGQSVRAALERAINSRRYDGLSDDQRRDLLENIIDRTRRQASQKMRGRVVREQPAVNDALGLR